MADSTELRIEVQEPTSWSRKVSITVPSERVQRARQSVTARIAGNVRLPGFRKGKMPQNLLERQFGPAIDQETVDRVIQDAYREVLTSRDFQPISQGQVENVQYAGGASELTFDVEFEVQPQVEIARTEGFQVVRPPEQVGDDEVDALLERLRQERATLHPLPEGATADYGDLVMVEITDLDQPEAAVGEEPAPAPEPRSYRFELGEGQAIPDIEQAIMTLAPDQENEFTVTFPEDFPEEAQRGRQQRLRIRLTEARRKELPALDDDFARELGDFETMDALRARVREDMEADARRRAEEAVRTGLLNQVIEANPFDVPGSMVERYTDLMLGQTDERGRRRPAGAEDEERNSQLRGLVRPQAEAAVKRMMVVEALADSQGLRATADDVDARVEALAAEGGRSPSEVWVELERSGQMQALEMEITEGKVFEFLRSRNTVAQG